MAHSLSSKKRIRQDTKRRALNRSRRSALRTRLRKCNDALVHQEVETAEKAIREACRALDREADRRLIHPNAAARRKSGLARRLNALKQQRDA